MIGNNKHPIGLGAVVIASADHHRVRWPKEVFAKPCEHRFGIDQLDVRLGCEPMRFLGNGERSVSGSQPLGFSGA